MKTILNNGIVTEPSKHSVEETVERPQGDPADQGNYAVRND